MFLHERVPFLAAPVYKRGWQARNAMVLRMSSVTYMHCSSGARRISLEGVAVWMCWSTLRELLVTPEKLISPETLSCGHASTRRISLRTEPSV